MAERLDRAAVARILERAHQIESSRQPVEVGGIEEGALIAAAEEVGIDPNAVRDSLAIEKLSIETGRERRLDRVAGPAQVVIERDVRLGVDEVLVALTAWLSSPYRLVVDRRSESTLLARRRTDVVAKLGRAVNNAQGEGRLALAALTVEAVPQVVGTTPTQPRSLVRLSADRASPRAVRLAGGGGLGAGGVGLGGAVAALSETALLLPAVAVPLVVGGYVVARSSRSQADRLELELERLLSRVERGERPTGLFGRVARRARKATRR
ncbi:MAG: hypothetical protein AB8G14_01565 [Ilumatobacter sp.]